MTEPGRSSEPFSASRPGGDAEPRPAGPRQAEHQRDQASHDEALARVRSRLLDLGASEAEIDGACREDVLDLLIVDRMLVPDERRYTQLDVAERTGMPIDQLRRFWRALGFLDVPMDDRLFTDLDIEAVERFRELLSLGAADMDTALQRARVIGSSMARIAEAEVVPDSIGPAEPFDSVLAADAFAATATATLPDITQLLEFVWRRHMQAATRRAMMLRSRREGVGTSPAMAVGFADMVGFTLLSQHLAEDELASVVRRFEEISHDIVTSLGGRVVKMIGDEAMFVVPEVLSAVRIGLDLSEAYADDELLSDVRVGLAFGPVLLRDGDYYGTTVNLAHRIVNIANPGTVLVSDEFRTTLVEAAPGEFTWKALRPRQLKDLGRVQLWWCGRAGSVPTGDGGTADERRNLRWERLSDVLRDIDGLRERGERLLTGVRAALVDAGPGEGASAPGEPDGGDAEGPELDGAVEGLDGSAPQVDHPA